MIDYKDAFLSRSIRLDKIRKDSLLLQASKIVYRNDPVQFINDWGMTYNPQIKPSSVPFILFPKQAEFIQFLDARNKLREDAVCEKCRNVGFTWLAVAYVVHQWLFNSEQKYTFGSRKRDLVDKIGDPDSIFEKIRFFIRQLPIEYLPRGFDFKKHMAFLRIMNPENGSIITGEAGDNLGRGGRSTMHILDEAAFIERPEIVDGALSETSECKISISTPNGVGNPFHQKRMGGVVKVFTFPWYSDPRKDQAWYDKRKATLDPVIFAREIEIDYGASRGDVVIPNRWIQAAINFNPEGIDRGQTVVGQDVADEGGDKNAFVMRKGLKVSYLESWLLGDTTQTARKVFSMCEEKKVDVLFYDSIGVGAGLKGELASQKKIKGEKFTILGISIGSTPANAKSWYENSDRKNEDMFLNLKAQIWWQLRRRFEKTYEHVNKIKEHPIEDLISIPDHAELIAELSSPGFYFREDGTIQIESKEDMRKRGVKSPNLADALILSFSPIQQASIRIL